MEGSGGRRGLLLRAATASAHHEQLTDPQGGQDEEAEQGTKEEETDHEEEEEEEEEENKGKGKGEGKRETERENGREGEGTWNMEYLASSSERRRTCRQTSYRMWLDRWKRSENGAVIENGKQPRVSVALDNL